MLSSSPGYAHSSLLDVAAILWRSISGNLVLPCLLPKKANFDYVHALGVYFTFITKNAMTQVEVSNTEHSAFLMYFFSKLGDCLVDVV